MLKTFKNVFRDRDYRRYLLLLTLTGAAGSAGMPLVPLYMTQELGASLAEVGVITVAGLAGVAINLPIGRLSDRMRSRTPLMCALAGWMAAGWVAIGLTDRFWQAIVVYVVFLSAPYGVFNAQVFASLGDTMTRRGEANQSTITSTLRAGYSFGFMLGPVASTALATAAGLRAAFLVAVGLYLSVLILTFVLRRLHVSGIASATASKSAPAGTGRLPLALFACGVCLVIVGDMLRSVYLPIYVVDTLHYSTVVFGVLIAVVAGVEVVVFPLMGMAADRFGIRRVIAAALALGVVAYAILASGDSLWQVVVFHLFQVVLFAATIGLGLTYAQGLTPGQSGLASSAFFSAQTAAKPLSGVAGFAAIGALGLPGIFWVPAALCAVCLVAFAAASIRARARRAAAVAVG